MININMLDNKLGEYIINKSNGLDISGVEIGITTSDLGFVDVGRSEGLNNRIEALNLNTKESFNQYAAEMKTLNREMLDACSEYAGIADFLGVEDEKDIRKLSKEQILKGAAYVQFLEDTKEMITFNFAKHMYFCCLVEGNALKKECMFTLEKLGKGFDYDQIYSNQVELLMEKDEKKSSTSWERWLPEKRTLIGYINSNLMRSNSKGMSEHTNHSEKEYSYNTQMKEKDGEESTLDILQRIAFTQYENGDSNADRDNKKVKLLGKIKEICTEEEFKVMCAFAEYIRYEEKIDELKNKDKTIEKLSRTEYINQYLDTNYTSRRIENIISTVREKLNTRKEHAKKLDNSKLFLQVINKELNKDYSLEELNNKLIWVKKEITKRKKIDSDKSEMDILLDSINRVFGTDYNSKNYSIVVVSLIQEGLNSTTNKRMDSEFMELLADYMKAQEKVDKYNTYADEVADKKMKEKEERLERYLSDNKTFKYLFNYLREHEKQPVSNFIQSYTKDAAWTYREDMMWAFIGKYMVEKHLDGIADYSKFVPKYDIKEFICNMTKGYLRGKKLLTNEDKMTIFKNDWEEGGFDLNFDLVKERMFEFEPEKAKELYEIIDRRLEMETDKDKEIGLGMLELENEYYGYECITL